MTASTETITVNDRELVEGVFDRISKDLSMIVDRKITVQGVSSERKNERPAGEGQVHISFRLAVTLPDASRSSSSLVVRSRTRAMKPRGSPCTSKAT